MIGTFRTSAAYLKSGHVRFRDLPHEGTVLREMYDWFILHPATPTHYKSFGTNGFCSFERLRNYGLDIRKHRMGYYWLVGQTDQSGNYRDFIAERVPA